MLLHLFPSRRSILDHSMVVQALQHILTCLPEAFRIRVQAFIPVVATGGFAINAVTGAAVTTIPVAFFYIIHWRRETEVSHVRWVSKKIT